MPLYLRSLLSVIYTTDRRGSRDEIAPEGHDFNLACFRRGASHELTGLSAERRRPVFVFPGRQTRRAHVLAFFSTTKDIKELLHHA